MFIPVIFVFFSVIFIYSSLFQWFFVMDKPFTINQKLKQFLWNPYLSA